MIINKLTKDDRILKTEVPFGWTQVERLIFSGKKVKEWRSPHIHKNKFSNKIERFSFACRKDRTVKVHQH